MVETCYASCRSACKSSCIDDEYALFTVQEIICGKVSVTILPALSHPFREMGALSYFQSEIEIWLKLRVCSEKLPEFKKQHQTDKIFTFYRISVLIDPFPVRNLRPNVESVHFCTCANIMLTKVT